MPMVELAEATILLVQVQDYSLRQGQASPRSKHQVALAPLKQEAVPVHPTVPVARCSERFAGLAKG